MTLNFDEIKKLVDRYNYNVKLQRTEIPFSILVNGENFSITEDNKNLYNFCLDQENSLIQDLLKFKL